MECNRSTNMQVADALGSIASSMLACDTSLKCVVDGDESSISHCMAHVLQSIDVQHSMGYIINSCVEDHHTCHRIGIRSLLTMTRFLSHHLMAFVDEGMPLSEVISLSNDAVRFCIVSLHQYSLPLKEFYDHDDVTQHSANQVEDADDVGWFFDDGRVPDLSTFPVVTGYCGESNGGIVGRENESMVATNIKVKASHEIDHVVEQDISDIDVGHHEDDCTDFDDCFEDVEFVDKMVPQTMDRKTNNVLIGKENANGCSELELLHGGEHSSSFLDRHSVGNTHNSEQCHELKSVCACSVDLGDITQMTTFVCKQKNCTEDACLPNEEQSRCDWSNLSTNQHSSSKSHTSKSNCTLTSCDHIADKLERILREKCRTTNENVMNRSRHFRTFHSSFSELNSSLDIKSTHSDVDCDKSNYISFHIMGAKNNSNVEMPTDSYQLFPDQIDAELWQSFRHQLSTSDHKLDKGGRHSAKRFEKGLRRLVNGLCRGCEEVSDILLHLLLKQNELNEKLSDFSFDLSRIHTSSCSGPLVDKPEIICGILLSMPSTRMMNLAPGKKKYRCLLVNGDIRYDFHHTGYVAKKNLTVTLTSVPDVSQSDMWLRDVYLLLKELQVSAVLVTGSADTNFIDFCDSEGLICITSVPFKALHSVASNSGVHATVYVTEASQENVASDICIRPCRIDWMDRLYPRMQHVVVEARNADVQSLLFTHPIVNIAKHRQERFWHCAHRLQHTLVDSLVLPGAGGAELHCAGKLLAEAETILSDENSDNLFRARVYESFAAAFENYTQVVRRNTDTNSTPTDVTIYDDYTSKIESLRSAVYLAGIVLRAGTEIITGIDGHFVRHGRSRDLCML